MQRPKQMGQPITTRRYLFLSFLNCSSQMFSGVIKGNKGHIWVKHRITPCSDLKVVYATTQLSGIIILCTVTFFTCDNANATYQIVGSLQCFLLWLIHVFKNGFYIRHLENKSLLSLLFRICTQSITLCIKMEFHHVASLPRKHG